MRSTPPPPCFYREAVGQGGSENHRRLRPRASQVSVCQPLSFPTSQGAATQDIGAEPHKQRLRRGPRPSHRVPNRPQHLAPSLHPRPRKASSVIASPQTVMGARALGNLPQRESLQNPGARYPWGPAPHHPPPHRTTLRPHPEDRDTAGGQVTELHHQQCPLSSVPPLCAHGWLLSLKPA